MADVLLRYGQYVEQEAGQFAGNYSLTDASVACHVCAWLAVVAKHMGFDEYV